MAASTGERGEIELGFWAKLGLGAGGRVSKAQKLILKATGEAATDAKGAADLYSRAIDLLNSTDGLPQERQQLLGRAHLSRGRIREVAGEAQGAVNDYVEARRRLPTLPLPALTYTAVSLAQP